MRNFQSGAPGEIEVWFWSLDVGDDERAALGAVLTADERARADRFIKAEDRNRWRVARGGLRLLLANLTGVAAADLRFSTEEKGRPCFAAPAASWPHFNLSHSGHLGALAVAHGVKIGVDVEAIRPIDADLEAFALAAAEQAALTGLTPAARQDAFFRYWTLKEAFLKAMGTGLAVPLQDFAMSPAGTGAPRLVASTTAMGTAEHWRFEEFQPAEGFRAAIAGFRPAGELKVRWHSPCNSLLGRAD